MKDHSKAGQVFANNELGTPKGAPVVRPLQFGPLLVRVFFLVLVGMVLFEASKQFFFQRLTLWQSHYLTICVVTIGSTIAGYFLLRSQGKIWQQVFLEETRGNSAEIKLRQSEELFRLISENVADLIAVLDLEGRRVYSSPSYKPILGDPDALHGTFSFNEIHPDDRDKIKRVFEETVRTGVGQRAEYRFLLKDGSIRFIESQGNVIRDRQGKPANVVVVSRDITERKQAEEALQQSKQRLSEVYEHVADVIFYLRVEPDDRYRFISVNPAFYKATGLREAQVVGKLVEEVIPEPSLTLVLGKYREAIQTRNIMRWEEASNYPGGTAIGEVSVTPVFDAERRPLYLIGSVRDVTERKRIEDRERDRSRILESLTAGASLATILDSLTRAMEAEDPTALCTILLLDKEGKHLLHGAAPSMPRFFIDAVQGLEVGEGVGSCGAAVFAKQRVVAEDLSLHPYWLPYRDLTQRAGLRSCWSEPILAANGQVLGTFGIYHRVPQSPDTNDVQRIKYAADFARLAIEYKQAEMALRESEERFRLISENVADLIAVVDLEGRRVYSSPSYKTILGDPDGLQGTLSFNEIHPDDRDKIKRVFEETVRTGVGLRAEYRFLLKDGSVRFIESQGSVIRDRQGKPANVVVVSRDVTEHRKLEQQLFQSQKMEAIGQLAGGVAHDFNNLLTVISGFSQLALDSLARDDPKRQQLEEVLRASDRAASLTRQLLAFSRRQTLQPSVLNLNEIVASMEKMLRRLIGEDIELVAALAPDLGRVKADPGQVEQIIMNLAVNARDAMPRGGKLTIETANIDLDEVYTSKHEPVKPGPHVMLAVSDTGCGMNAEIQARIFEPFFTTKEKGKGTGLGLATVYGIVKQSDGHIWVYSEPGRGTTFKVYLPLVQEESAAAKPSGAPSGALSGNETILLVEDEEPVRRLVRAVLESNGYKVLIAMRGDEALSLANRHKSLINLMITDIVMPGMSGPELAGRLAADRPETKVLFMSGYTDDTVVRHHLLDPNTPFLQKPFKPETLARKVREVLDS